jgi:predicted nucleotide-binding protein
MEKKDAVKFLRNQLPKIPELSRLRYDNTEVREWLTVIKGIVEKIWGRNSYEWERVSIQYPIEGIFDTDRQNSYKNNLISIRTNIIAIIKLNEVIGMDNKTLDASISNVNASSSILKTFISHGHGGDALLKLERFVEAFGIKPIIVKDQANADRNIEQKVNDYLNDVDFVIVFATGDDEVVEKGKKVIQPRQNVIHEIGLAQKTLPGKIIYLLEGKAQFPSNISPKVWYKFERHCMDEAFVGIVKELVNWGFINAAK